MFKNGDDLRQDILTLQMIDIMDRIWLDNHLDLAMTPYKVLPTDCEQGYLEFNLNSVTLAFMQHKDNTSYLGCFSDTCVHDFFVTKVIEVLSNANERYKHFSSYKRVEPIKDLAKTDQVAADFMKEFDQRLDKIRDVFIRSCAGYCVASYVLGLGDRHPDNIMINYLEGNFYHIDFGHFLEHKKLMPVVKIRRELDPFVFTPELAYFINGKSFKETKKQSKQLKKQKKARDAERDAQLESNLEDGEEKGLTQEEYSALSSFLYNGQGDSELVKLDKLENGGGAAETSINIEKNQTENFLRFQRYCCQAYNLLRHNANKIINLFLIMLSAGMPELQNKEHIGRLQDKLNLMSSDREAEKIFIREIKDAMTTFSRRMDNLAHNYKQIKADKKKNAALKKRMKRIELEQKQAAAQEQ